MTETLSTIRATVANMVLRTSAEDLADIDKCINHVVTHYARRGGDYMQRGEGAFATVADQQWYSAVDFSSSFGAESGLGSVDIADVLLIENMKVTPGASGYDDSITRLNFEDFERISNGDDVSQWPQHYTIHAERIGLWPIPNAVMTIQVAGLVRPSALGADDSTTPALNRMTDLIETASAARYQRVYARDYEDAMQLEALASDIWDGIWLEQTRKIGTGRIRPREY